MVVAVFVAHSPLNLFRMVFFLSLALLTWHNMSWHFAHDFFYIVFLFAIIFMWGGMWVCVWCGNMQNKSYIHLTVSVCFVFAFSIHSLRFDLVFKYAVDAIRMSRYKLLYYVLFYFVVSVICFSVFFSLGILLLAFVFIRTCALWSFL